jgi:hypothetical protein
MYLLYLACWSKCLDLTYETQELGSGA